MDEVYLNLVTQVFNRPAAYLRFMVGEEQVPSYREIRTYVFELREAVKVYEINLVLSKPADTQQVTGLAQRVLDMIAKKTAGMDHLPNAVFNWQLEAQGAMLKYAEEKAATAGKAKQLDDTFFKEARVIEF